MEQQIAFVTETTISEFVASINALRDEKTMKRLTIKSITEELLAEGYLERSSGTDTQNLSDRKRRSAGHPGRREGKSERKSVRCLFIRGKSSAVCGRVIKKKHYSGLIPANPLQIQDSVNKIPKTEVKYKNNSFPVL